jgi:hypothetical protein
MMEAVKFTIKHGVIIIIIIIIILIVIKFRILQYLRLPTDRHQVAAVVKPVT